MIGFMNRNSTQSSTHRAARRLQLCRDSAFCWALGGVLLVLLWQAATVHFNFAGHWSALFCTSGLRSQPPELAGTWTFPNSTGFDGQFYRYVAHDPWLRRGWSRYMDAPLLRRSRILLPAAAWLVGLGQDRYIDAAYIALMLFSIFLGTWWLGRWAELHGSHPAWGLWFLLLPATLTSIDRMTVDAAVVSACAGVLYYRARGARGRLLVLLAAAALVRETGLLLVAGCFLYALSKRHWREAACMAAAGLPACAWSAFVAVRTTPVASPGWWHSLFQYPLAGMAIKLFEPQPYPFAPRLTALVQVLDGMALAGFLAASLLALWSLRRRPLGLEQWLTLAFLMLVFALGRPTYWDNVYNYARPLSPLLFLMSLPAVTGRARWALAPILLIDLRIAAQCAPQAWGILRALL